MTRLARFHSDKPSPYLAMHWQTLAGPDKLFRDKRVVDLGGGNGRNTLFLQEQGFRRTTLVDKQGDYGVKCEMGVDRLPFADWYADIILAQYVFMFITSASQRFHALAEIWRISKPGCFFMCETQWLPTNPQSVVSTREQAAEFSERLSTLLNWDTVHKTKYRFIARKPIH